MSLYPRIEPKGCKECDKLILYSDVRTSVQTEVDVGVAVSPEAAIA